jgi:glutamyl-tRNA reductase
MSLYTLGLNHRTAPLDVREQIAFSPDALGHALRDLLARPKVKEAAILSTCNRTEVYVHTAEPQPVARWLEEFHRVPAESLSPHLYTLPRVETVTHAFRVASGLDSMVLGEPQILGQMKQAVRHAEAAGSLGLVLNRLFQRTFAVAKDVRTQTDIGSASISMAAAAVKLAERIFPALSEERLLLIGAGDMIDLTATHFAARNPRSITIANRTLERGRELAARFHAEAITLNEMPGAPARVRHRRHVHREHAPDSRQGTARARHQGAPARADLHRRSGGPARRRARGCRSFPTSFSTASTTCRTSSRTTCRSGRKP